MSKLKVTLIVEPHNPYSSTPVKKYLILVKPQLNTINDFIEHISDVICLDGTIKRLKMDEYSIPFTESIGVLRQGETYRCVYEGGMDIEEEVMEGEEEMGEEVEEQEQEESQSERSEQRLQIELEQKVTKDNPVAIQNNNKIHFHQRSHSPSEQSSQQPSQQHQPKKKPPKPKQQPISDQPPKKQISLEEFIAGQVNFYFSDKNYYNDDFILNHCEFSEGRWMDTNLLLRFPKIKKVLTRQDKLIHFLQIYEHPNKTYQLNETGNKIRKNSP